MGLKGEKMSRKARSGGTTFGPGAKDQVDMKFGGGIFKESVRLPRRAIDLGGYSCKTPQENLGKMGLSATSFLGEEGRTKS